MRLLAALMALAFAAACNKTEKVPERKKVAVAAPVPAAASGSGTGSTSGGASTAQTAGSGTGTGDDQASELDPAAPPVTAVATLGDFAITEVGTLAGQIAFKLTWSLSTEAAAYDVTVAPDATCQALTPTYADVKDPTVDVAKLAEGDYYVCVTAKHASGLKKNARNNGVKFHVPANKRPTAGAVTLDAIVSPFLGGSALSVAGKIADFADPDGDAPELDLGANDCAVELHHDAGALDFTLTKDAMGDRPCTVEVKLKDATALCTACTSAKQKLAYLGPVKEINANSTASSLPAGVDPSFVALGGKALFLAATRLAGSELWLSDGTEDGTALLKDIAADDADGAGPKVVVMGGAAFFRGHDAAHGAELWKTDGTADGTVLVKDIAAGAAGSSPDQLHVFSGKLYFSADDGVKGRELWVSDGTEAGTTLLLDINTGAPASDPKGFAAVGSTLFFAATTVAAGSELFKTDGTAVGTVLVKDLVAGATGSNPEQLTALGTSLIFVATTAANGSELFKSDGTSGGTALLKEIGAGATGSDPHELTVLGTKLFFTATDATNGTELFKSDGTSGGTALASNIKAGAASSSPKGLTVMGPNVYFFADDGTNGRELWKSDGATTAMVKDLNAAAADAIAATDAPALFADGATLYFAASDGSAGAQLWKTDGTAANTALVKAVADPAWFAKIGTAIYFAGTDAQGREPWVTDGTADGTKMVKDLEPGNADAVATLEPLGNLFRINNTGIALFTADDGAHGRELWKTNGTAVGTVMIADIDAGAAASTATVHRPVALADNKVIFAADDGVHGSEPWISDLTSAGTTMIKDIALNAPGSNPAHFTKCGTQVYFTADDGTSGAELFSTDGTPGHTTLVQNLKFGANAGSNPTELTCMAGILYFAADGSTGNSPGTPKGVELWKWDGTLASLVKDVAANAASSSPYGLTVAGTQLFFFATNAAANTELYVSDGTGANTTLVKEINASTTVGSDPARPFAFGTTLLFVADDGTHGRELWKSDGTDAGTALVKDLVDGAGSSDPLPLAQMGGFVYFFAADAAGKSHLYRTDATADGTTEVSPQDFAPLATPVGDPGAVAKSSGSYLYFQADDGAHGRELWRSDGTADGTYMLGDIGRPGAIGSAPWSPLYIGRNLLFQATTPAKGRELYQYAPAPD